MAATHGGSGNGMVQLHSVALAAIMTAREGDVA